MLENKVEEVNLMPKIRGARGNILVILGHKMVYYWGNWGQYPLSLIEKVMFEVLDAF